MKEKWMAINRKKEFEELNAQTNLHPLITRLLANRGIQSSKEASIFLDGNISDLYDGILMKDMSKGIDIIKEAILTNKKIAIYGDYDCDGVCSTTILYKTLKALKANFQYHIPNREDEGYGMNSNRIKKLKEEGVEVILTCDNGISAMEEVKFAKELGIKVVITDHHDIPYIEKDGVRISVVPEGDAVINPKQDDAYPFKELCGAGVALKFSQILFDVMGKDFNNYEELYQYAGIATVCDVVELLGENRIIVKKAIEIINRTQNKGLRELIKACGLESKTIGEYHFGFVLGPCINATGRLETADLSVELLITDDDKRAKELAEKLHELNVIRQELTSESVERVLEKIRVEKDEYDKVIFVYDGEIHESIAGIVAGRVREYYNLPTIVMTKGKDMPKGSARSIEGYNMFEELNKCKEYIFKFGGHPMAAGLSVEEDKMHLLKKELLLKCPLSEEDIIPIVKIDSPLPIESINGELISKIEKLRPFGKGNSSPLLGAKNVQVMRIFFMGKEGKFMKFRFRNAITGGYIEGINFDKFEDFKQDFLEKYGEERFLKLQDDGYGGFNMDIIYYPTINEFNGNKSIQLNIKAFRL